MYNHTLFLKYIIYSFCAPGILRFVIVAFSLYLYLYFHMFAFFSQISCTVAASQKLRRITGPTKTSVDKFVGIEVSNACVKYQLHFVISDV